MIKIPNSEGIIWKVEDNIIDIINEYQRTGSAVIDLNGEGPCCETLGLYRILDRICETFGFDKTKITIQTRNQIERHDAYNIKILENIFYKRSYNLKEVALGMAPDCKHIGFFVGRSNYIRLWFLGWLDPEKSLVTSHINTNDDASIAQLGMDDMVRWGCSPDDLRGAVNVIEKSPMQIDDIDSFPVSLGNANLLKIYDQFFAELVCETYFTGNVFFATEKTFRPMVAKTPFIIHASPGFLKELKKLGYRTFDKWWSEEYDDYGEQLRVQKIQEVINLIMEWDHGRLLEVYEEMMPVLEHNRRLYLEFSRK